MDNELPATPDEVQAVLKCTGIVNKEVSWKIHNGKIKISVMLVWPKEAPVLKDKRKALHQAP